MKNKVFRNGWKRGGVAEIKGVLAAMIVRITDKDALDGRLLQEQSGILRQEFSLIRKGKLAGFKVDRLIRMIEKLGYKVKADFTFMASIGGKTK